ncbi:MAG: biotin/lipoyl-containing protein [Myxococcota bacterium]|jgi:biotin carboxyl carrier protein|nr:biotin/lipoyl-containing protein [Myxococcota bacterium]
MEFWLEIDGETVDFDVTREGEEILVTRNGVTHRATMEQSGATYRVMIDGTAFELTRDGEEPRGGGGERMTLTRESMSHEIGWVARKSSACSDGLEEVSDGEVHPLMPGGIIEVNVQAGDVVHEGDVLLVLEAMKMQNEVVAPVSGTVTEVNVRPGDSVDRSTMMVRIDPEGPGGS